jgi:hypothetical protein
VEEPHLLRAIDGAAIHELVAQPATRKDSAMLRDTACAPAPVSGDKQPRRRQSLLRPQDAIRIGEIVQPFSGRDASEEPNRERTWNPDPDRNRGRLTIVLYCTPSVATASSIRECAGSRA